MFKNKYISIITTEILDKSQSLGKAKYCFPLHTLVAVENIFSSDHKVPIKKC